MDNYNSHLLLIRLPLLDSRVSTGYMCMMDTFPMDSRLLTHREVQPGGARKSALVTESGALLT